MRKNAVIPYALVAGIGILLIIVVSFVGLNQQEAVQEDNEGQEEQAEDQSGGDSSGEKTSVDGEEVFQNNCASCHGQDLSGDVGPALDTIGSDHSKEDIKGIIDKGPGSMPPGVVEGEKQDAVAEWLSKKK